MKIIRLISSALFFLMLCTQAHAQLFDPVIYHITKAPDQVKAGERFKVTVQAKIEGDWHLYSALNDPDAGPYPTTFSSAADRLVIAGDISETEPRIVLDPNFNTELGWHSQEAFFTIPVAFDTAAQGNKWVSLDILYQVCDDRSCLPPKTKQVTTAITVAGLADVPFIINNTSGKGFFYSLYRSPTALVSVLENREWIFWLIAIFGVFTLFFYKRPKHRAFSQ